MRNTLSAWRSMSTSPMYTTHSRPSSAAAVAAATPCWPAPVSATTRCLPMRLASSAWPSTLLILCEPGVVEVLALEQQRAAELGGEPLAPRRGATGGRRSRAAGRRARRGRPGRPTRRGTPGRARRTPAPASRGCSGRRSRRSARTAPGHPSPARRTSVEREPRTSASASPFGSTDRWLRADGDGTVRSVAEAFGWGLVGGLALLIGAFLSFGSFITVTRPGSGDGVRRRRADQRRRLRPRRGGLHDLRPERHRRRRAAGRRRSSSSWATRPSTGWAAPNRKRSSGDQAGDSPFGIVLGAVLDGIPESIVLGATLLTGEGISTAFVAAVFISNLPEGLAGSTGLARAGWSRRHIIGLWSLVAAGVGDRRRARLRVPGRRVARDHRVHPRLRRRRGAHDAGRHDDAGGLRARRPGGRPA